MAMAQNSMGWDDNIDARWPTIQIPTAPGRMCGRPIPEEELHKEEGGRESRKLTRG